MNFTVTWLALAQDELAAIWTDAPDRNAITAASDRVERRLAADAPGEGESRGGRDRITFERPPRVMFRVHEDRRLVEVMSVGVFGPRGGA